MPSLAPGTYLHRGPQGPLIRREGRSLRPPIFLERFPSGVDNGRGRLIKAQSRLRSVGNYPRLQRGLSLVIDMPVQTLNQG